MASYLVTPTIITQSAESPVHVAWKETDGKLYYLKHFDEQMTNTVGPLFHTANPYAGDRLMKTWYLNFTGFKFIWPYGATSPTLPVTGFEIVLKTQRSGRIVDDTVQLVNKNKVVGTNYASINLGMTKIYGGFQDTWGLTFTNVNEVLALIQDPTFGVTVRLQSHPSWPHREVPGIDTVLIRLLNDTSTDLRGYNILTGKRPGGGYGSDTVEEDGFSEGDSDGQAVSRGRRPGVGETSLKPIISAKGKLPGLDNYNMRTSPPTGYGGSPAYIGSSDGYQGSTGYLGSTNYVGSAGFVGSTGFMGSGSGTVTGIPDISYLPARGNYIGESYNILNLGIILFWDGSTWVRIGT